MQQWRRPCLATKGRVLAEESLRVNATPSQLEALSAALGHFWLIVEDHLGSSLCHIWRLQFETAVGEIGANIARHAYSQHQQGQMSLRLHLFADRVEAYFTDHGIAFSQPSKPRADVGDDVFSLPEGGYGLSIARSGLDQMNYRRTAGGTNSWRLVKILPKGAG